jgi:hydroxyacylglutathione hydrolase
MAAPFDLRPDVRHGVAEPVAPGVRRVTCANPSPMTFTGTRSYIVGEGEVAVIDPGPDDPAHIDALLGALEPGEDVAAILVTHSHADHSPGARTLARRTGAPVLAFGAHGAGMSAAMADLSAAGFDLGGGEGADRDFAPDRLLTDGETVRGRGWRLAALHTPGHLSNHLSFALGDTGIVFTGDAVMGWTTTLVSPPEGDMAAQMATLRRMAGRGNRLFLPGHGHEVSEPAVLIRHLIRHREAREAQILAALVEAGGGTAESLAARVYRDTDPRLLPAAARNVLATLLGLLAEGRVDCPGSLSAMAEFRPVGR